MQLFLVGVWNDPVGAELGGVPEELGLSPTVFPNLVRLRSDSLFTEAPNPLVVVLETPSDPLALAETIDLAQEQSGRAFVVWLAQSIEPDQYKKLVRTGAAEWITFDNCREELRDVVARLNAVAPNERTAKILSFIPSKGGVGVTTLAIETAIYLSTRRKRNAPKIAILDLNLQGGTVADALDVEPRFNVTEIVDRPDRLDEQLIDIFTSRHSKRLDVFASPMSRFRSEAVKPEVVFTFIDSISARYDAIFFDLPVHWSIWTDSLLLGSDAIIVCGQESVPGLRRLAATLLHIDGLAIAENKVAAVVNAVETDLLGRVSRRAVIERALAQRRTFFIRRDSRNTSNALDVGRPLLELAPTSRIAKDVRRLAEWIETIADHSQKARSRPALSRKAVA